jgi:hypothetical protein
MALSRIRIPICTKPPSTGTLTFRISIIGIGIGERGRMKPSPPFAWWIQSAQD